MAEMKKQPISRAEALRQRNEKAGGEWLSHVNRRLEEPPQNEGKFNNFWRKKSKRNFSDSENSSDMSFSPASHIEKHFFRPGWRLLSFAFTALFTAGLVSAWRMPEFRVGEIEINGVSRIDAQSIRNILEFKDQPSFLLQPGEIEKKIAETFPELMNIDVKIGVPSKVTVTADERQPYASWTTNGRVLWIDTKGELIPARGNAEISLNVIADSLPPIARNIRNMRYTIDKAVYNKPVIKPVELSLSFFYSRKTIDESILKAMLSLAIWLPDEKTFLYEKTRGLGWNDMRGWKVFVGTDLRDLNQKMVLYETIVKELEKTETTPVLISVEYLTAPYYRTE